MKMTTEAVKTYWLIESCVIQKSQVVNDQLVKYEYVMPDTSFFVYSIPENCKYHNGRWHCIIVRQNYKR